MKKQIITIFLLTGFWFANAQEPMTKVILITLDGLRWEEMFKGADSLLIANEDYVENTKHLKEKFWRTTSEERRQALMPFVWSFVNENGQIHGNRELGSKVTLSNQMHFSYPGYNEILTGNSDDINIHSNDKIYNPNVTVLEKVNNKKHYKGKVAAFGSWDLFPYIINDKRSGIPVNGGFRKANGNNLTDREVFLNELQDQIPGPWDSVRLDAFTHHFALENFKKNHPLLTYISYGETDDFAHDGKYDYYLTSANRSDAFIKQLWEFTQKDPFYKDQTVFIITTDHGRGHEPLDTWRSHGSDIEGSEQTWMLMFGKGIKVLGEVSQKEDLSPTLISPMIEDYFSK